MSKWMAAGNDSTGLLNVVVINQNANNQPYIITQNLDGSWRPALAMPNSANRGYSAVTATLSVTNELLILLLDQQRGLPYSTQIVAGAAAQVPEPIAFKNGALPEGSSFASLATGGDTESDLLLVFLIATGEFAFGADQNNNIFMIAQAPDGSWQVLGDFITFTGLPETVWGVEPADLNVNAAATGVGGAMLQVAFVVIRPPSNLPVIVTENARDAWSASILPANYPNGYPIANPIVGVLNSDAPIATGIGNSGFLQVVVLGGDGNAYLLWCDENGTWNFPVQYTLPNPHDLFFTAVAMGTGNNAGKLQVIVLAEGLPCLIWQDTNGVWNWHGQLPLGNLTQGVTFTAVTTGVGNDTRLQVLLLGSDGHVYLIWQDITGEWFPHQDASNAMIALL